MPISRFGRHRIVFFHVLNASKSVGELVLSMVNSPMSEPLPPCPYLPAPPAGIDHRHLRVHGTSRNAAFYLACLEYGHDLWMRGFAARAVLCLDRAMGADLSGDEPEVQANPMPYAAMAWFLTHTPPQVFIGNPRVHFQHYADRMNEPRCEQRRWRAWACWALARALRPEWPPDARHTVIEPTEAIIADELDRHGLPGERAHWRAILSSPFPAS
jgi:hypothetical protein